MLIIRQICFNIISLTAKASVVKARLVVQMLKRKSLTPRP
jgi:hypothetical protein